MPRVRGGREGGGGPGQPGAQRLNERHSVAVEHDKEAEIFIFWNMYLR